MQVEKSNMKPMRMALLLTWSKQGYTRPHYGLVDGEELTLTGRSTFVSTDGRHVLATRKDLLLLQPASSDADTTAN